MPPAPPAGCLDRIRRARGRAADEEELHAACVDGGELLKRVEVDDLHDLESGLLEAAADLLLVPGELAVSLPDLHPLAVGERGPAGDQAESDAVASAEPGGALEVVIAAARDVRLAHAPHGRIDVGMIHVEQEQRVLRHDRADAAERTNQVV